ncbi:MAG: isopentenyl-diphosphate Delta-isomerase [Steroidobacteraceae bacterium]
MNNVRATVAGACADISADSETLILVDEADREVGHLSKERCHAGTGVLHRAFSLLVFNADGALLLQRRSPAKRLWPLHWSNSCCSHPRRNEAMEAATQRRLHEELGIRCPLKFLFKFRYQAEFGIAGSEHELCSVYIGHHSGPLRVNGGEIDGWRWIAPDALDRELADRPAEFTPWFVLEWERIRRDHGGELEQLRSRRGA